jgi:hypothetical protein
MAWIGKGCGQTVPFMSSRSTQKIWLTTTQKAEADPWVTICVDFIDPFTIMNYYKTHTLRALTIIDPSSGWFEIVQATNKLPTIIHDFFHNTWLACYPRRQNLKVLA